MDKDIKDAMNDVNVHTCEYYTDSKSWKASLPDDSTLESVLAKAKETLAACNGGKVKASMEHLSKDWLAH